MRALILDRYGSLDGFHVSDLPSEEPAAGEVRVKVHAAALNPADYKVALGQTKILHARRFPMILGYDLSGVVDAVGEGVTRFSPGDAVFGFFEYNGKTKRGAFAELAVLREDQLAKKPESVAHAVAAAAATPVLTAIQGMRDLGGLGAGGSVLIVGAGGGVGTAAIGVAKRLGASITAIVSSHSVELVRELGADRVIDRKKEDPLATANGPFDVVFDAADAHSYGACKQLLKPGGVYVTTLPSTRWAAGKLSSLVSSKHVRLVVVKPRAVDLELCATWLADGMPIPIDRTVPLGAMKDALGRLQKGGVNGRVAVDVIGGF